MSTSHAKKKTHNKQGSSSSSSSSSSNTVPTTYVDSGNGDDEENEDDGTSTSSPGLTTTGGTEPPFSTSSSSSNNNYNNSSNPPVPPTAPIGSSNGICKVYMEHLETKLEITDDCPVCNFPVAYHDHQPTPSSSSSISTLSLPITSVPSGSARYYEFGKMIPVLEKVKWKKGEQTRSVFVILKNKMELCNVNPADYCNALSILVDDDPYAFKWVQNNILIPKLDWDDGCKAFTAHFQSTDTTTQLQRQFKELKQGYNEEVMVYATNFQSLVSELDIPDNKETILKFIDGLNRNRKEKFLHQVLTLKAIGSPKADYEKLPLDEVMKFCIDIDVAERTIQDTMNNDHSSRYGNRHPSPGDGSHSDHHGNNSRKDKSGGSNGNGKTRHCDYHPTLTNHTTADCVKNPANAKKKANAGNGSKHCDNHPGATNHSTAECKMNRPTTGSTPSSAGTPSTGPRCYNCNSPGSSIS